MADTWVNRKDFFLILKFSLNDSGGGEATLITRMGAIRRICRNGTQDNGPQAGRREPGVRRLRGQVERYCSKETGTCAPRGTKKKKMYSVIS